MSGGSRGGLSGRSLAEAEPDENEEAGPSVSEKIAEAIKTLRSDIRNEGGLGDAARQTRNILVSNAAWELRGLVIDSPEVLCLAVEAGSIQAVIRALRQRPNSEAVQSKCTTTLGYLAANDPAFKTIAGKEGGIEAVISALRGHPNSVSVIEHASEALGQLVVDHYVNQNLAGVAGGIEAVAVTLQQHPENEAIQKNAALTLGLLVIDNLDNQLHAGRVRAIQAIISCLKSHLRNEAVIGIAAEALRHVVADNDENRGLAREVGAIATVVAVLRRHRKHEKVQVTCLRTATEIVTDNSDNQAIAGEAGAIRAIALALNGHPGSDDVQERACEALGHLVANNQVNQNLSREAGLIEAVIHTALELHPASIPVQTKASATLSSLVANNAESQKLAGAAGGVEVVTAGLKRHLDCEAVTEVASMALSNLVLNNRENQTLARAAGAMETVILVLRQHPSNPVVQTRALNSLRNLIVGNHENTRVAVSAGGIDEVVSALRQPPEGTERCTSRGSSRSGKRPTSEASAEESRSRKHHSYQKLAREAGVIEACVGALKQPPKTDMNKVILNKVNVIPSAKLLMALRDLVTSSYESQRLAAEAGAVETVIDLLRDEILSEVIQEHAAKALCGLIVDNAACQRRAKSAMARDALAEAETAHPDNIDVQEASAQAREALRSGETFAEHIMSTDYGKQHSSPVSIVDTAMRGVTLGQLLELQDFIQKTLKKHDLVDSPSSETSQLQKAKSGIENLKDRSLTWEELTMYQIRDHFILPLTRQNNGSFVEIVAPKPQPPMWMISHWWGTPLPFTVRMLQLQSRSRHLHDTSSVAYWCCAFANNQNAPSELDESDVLRSPFARAMLSQSCMGTVLLCDTEVTPLLRTWCVFETHVTQMLRCGELADRTDKKRYFLDILAPVVTKDAPEANELDKVTITMLQDAVGGSWNEVSDTPGVFFPLDIAHMGVGLDVRMADTSVGTDKAMILNFLTGGKASKEPPPTVHPKYEELNNFVHSVFASAELYRVASEQPKECVEAASELIQMRADVNSFVRQGNTPLFAAAGADPARAGCGDTNMQLDLVELLLNSRADVNRANASLQTVLDVSASLSEKTRGLLLQHGAKSFTDAAPDLERSANANLIGVLATGFGSEAQAFVGGDAGTRLTAAAQHSLQVVATSILNLYHWAPCRMCIQTGAKRFQAQLAGERARSIMLGLESAGCKNSFEIHFGTQRVLLSLTLSIAPRLEQSALIPDPTPFDKMKIARWDREKADVPGADKTGTVSRNQLVELALRQGSDRAKPLPPVTLPAGRSQASMVPHVTPTTEHSGTASPQKILIASGILVQRTAATSTEPSSPSGGRRTFNRMGSGGSLRGDGQIDLEDSIFSNGSSCCEMEAAREALGAREALTGNSWAEMSSNRDPDRGRESFGSRDPDRPTTRQDKRRPEVVASRCEAWGNPAWSSGGSTSQQASSGGFKQGSSSGFKQARRPSISSGPTSDTEAYRKKSPDMSEHSRTAYRESSVPSGVSADLDALAAGDRWFQTSVRCSLSQTDLHSPKTTQARRQSQQNREKNLYAGTSNAQSFGPGVIIDQFGSGVPPTPSGSRPRPGKTAVPLVVESGPSDDGRPPTRMGRRPEPAPSGIPKQSPSAVSKVQRPAAQRSDRAITGLRQTNGAAPAAADQSPGGREWLGTTKTGLSIAGREVDQALEPQVTPEDVMLGRTYSLPALKRPAPSPGRSTQFRVSDLME